MTDKSPADDPNLQSRRERAAGRILDDERLRGDLTDDEFKPLLDWALDVMDQVVLSTAGEDDLRAEDAIGTATNEISDLLTEADRAIQAHRDGRAVDRRDALTDIGTMLHGRYRSGGVNEDAVRRPLERLADRLDAEPKLDTVTVARELVRAMTQPARAAPTSRNP